MRILIVEETSSKRQPYYKHDKNGVNTREILNFDLNKINIYDENSFFV